MDFWEAVGLWMSWYRYMGSSSYASCSIRMEAAIITTLHCIEDPTHPNTTDGLYVCLSRAWELCSCSVIYSCQIHDFNHYHCMPLDWVFFPPLTIHISHHTPTFLPLEYDFLMGQYLQAPTPAIHLQASDNGLSGAAMKHLKLPGMLTVNFFI